MRSPSACLVKVERVAVKVSEHVILKHFLVAVQWELLAAHWAHFPVALHVLLKLVLIVVGWEDDLTQRASLHVHAAHTGRRGKAPPVSGEVMISASSEISLIKSICLMFRGWPVP